LRIKCSGAVGTFSMIDPIVEKSLASKYEIQSETIATQVIPRERIALLMSILSIIASCIERFAIEIRHLQRTEVGEVFEGFKPGQKGSSAMPHKKNPILTENLTGLCRTVRMALIPSMENIALWHERDISHSSVERITLPDTFTHLSFALKRTKNVIDEMIINENKMMDNLWLTNGLIFSQQILLKLIGKGCTREDAYSIVQRCAHNDKNLFVENLSNEKIFNDYEITECFDLKKYIKNIDYIYERVLI
jgi:adenylosuccinate lyase